MKFFYLYFKVFGLATMNVELNKNYKIKKWIFTYSRLGNVYNIALICFLSVLKFFCIRLMFEFYDVSGGNQFDKIIDLARLVISVVGSIIILFKFCICQETAIRIVNRIIAFQEYCSVSDFKQFYRNKDVLINILEIFIVNASIWIVMIFSSKMYRDKKSMTFYTATFSCDLIINYTIIQYSILLKLISEFFHSVNSYLTYYLKNVSIYNKMYVINDFVPKKLDHFIDIHNMHLRLCEISKELSDYYSLPMILCLSHVFVSVLLYGFFVLKSILVTASSTAISTDQYMLCFFTLLENTSLLVSLTTSVTRIISEVKFQKIGKILFLNECIIHF